jgi:hypothetical protein
MAHQSASTFAAASFVMVRLFAPANFPNPMIALRDQQIAPASSIALASPSALNRNTASESTMSAPRAAAIAASGRTRG